GRAVAAATTSFRGNVSSIASLYGRNNSGTYMLQEQEPHAAEMERTFIAIKPDGVQRGLISEIVGFKLVAIKLIVPSKDFAQKHYHDRKERPFFNGLRDFLGGPVLAMVWEGLEGYFLGVIRMILKSIFKVSHGCNRSTKTVSSPISIYLLNRLTPELLSICLVSSSSISN
ncbi:hypothetical protein MKW92_044330, partial [Papaver armeniacum]